MEKLTLSKKVVEEDLIKNAKPIFNPFQKKIQLNKSNDKEREFNANTMQNNLYDTLSETTAKVEEEDQEEAEEEEEPEEEPKQENKEEKKQHDTPISPIFYNYDGKIYTVDNGNFLQRNFSNIESDIDYKMNLCIYKCVKKGCVPYLLYLMIYDETTNTLIFPQYTITSGSDEETEEDIEDRMLNNFKEALFHIYPPGILLKNDELSEPYDIYTADFFRGFYVHDKNEATSEFGMMTMVYDATRVNVPLSDDKQYYWVTPYEMFASKQVNHIKINVDIISSIASANGSLDKTFYHLKEFETNEIVKDPYVLFLCNSVESTSATFENVVFDEESENNVQIIYSRTRHPILGTYTFFSSHTTITNGKRFAVFVDIDDLHPLYVEPEQSEILSHLYDLDQEHSYSAITFMNGSQQLWCIKSPIYFSEIEETPYKNKSSDLNEPSTDLL